MSVVYAVVRHSLKNPEEPSANVFALCYNKETAQKKADRGNREWCDFDYRVETWRIDES